MPLRFDPAQRFTCAGCARCCHGEVVITPGEKERYERASAGRWFRERADLPEGAAGEPFTPMPGRPGWFRLRRRPDGACGFLSPQNRCRLHEELGGANKPLVCRMFPFAVHRTERDVLMSASFTCPTVAANEGQPLGEQGALLGGLRTEWEKAFGRGHHPLLLVSGRPMEGRTLDTVRERLAQLLDASAGQGATGLARSVRRMTAWIEDLSRPKVLRLPPDDVAEYAAVTGRYAVENERPLPRPRPSRLSRVRARGIVFVAASAEIQRKRTGTGARLGLRWQILRLLLHAHGMAGATADLDVSARRRVSLDREAVAPVVRHYLRSTLATLGTGARPLLGELGHAAAVLNAALTLGARHAVAAGKTAIDADALREGLVRASDLGHLEGRVASAVDSFASGADSWTLLSEALGAE